MIGGLGAGREPDRAGAERLGHLGEQRGELVVALDRDRRPVEGRDRPLRVGERDERMERADLRAGGHRRARGPRRRATPLVWTIAWPLYSRISAATSAMASSGTARMMSSTSSTSAVGSAKARAPRPGSGTAPDAPGSRLATAWTGQPARVRATPERRPDGPGPDDPDDGGSPGLACWCGMRGGRARGHPRRADGGPAAAGRGRSRHPRWPLIVSSASPLAPSGRLARAGRPRPSPAARPRRSRPTRGTLPPIECTRAQRGERVPSPRSVRRPGVASAPGYPTIYRLDALGGSDRPRRARPSR